MDEFLKQLQAIQQAHQSAADFQKSLLLLRALKDGRVGLDQITVADDGWTVSAEPAALPAVLDLRRNGVFQAEEPAPAE